MITSYKQALAIQTRRVQANRRGYAKAVRRYFLHHQPDHYKTIRGQLPLVTPRSWLHEFELHELTSYPGCSGAGITQKKEAA